MNFDVFKDELIKDYIELNTKSDFDKKFLSLIESLVIEMMENEDAFFGSFMVQTKRNLDFSIEWPIVTIPVTDGFKMTFNPKSFLSYTKNEMKALIKHEIYHIMFNHYERERDLRQRYDKLAVNLALDLSINQFIKNIPMEYTRIHSINMKYNLELKENMSCEYYAEVLHKAINNKKEPLKIDTKDKSDINIKNAHDLWWQSSISQEISRNLAKTVAINSYNGKAPDEIGKIILGYEEKAEISWQKLLKKMIPSLRAGTKNTITRRNRRQPERLDLKGELPNNIPEILVAIDISASMTDEEINKIMIEILEISKSRGNIVTVIECDDDIRRIYKIRSVKDIKKRKRNNGSTRFSPVFKYIKSNNMRNVILIYFTDGVGEKELEIRPINKNTIWVLTGKEELSLDKSYGSIKRISKEFEEGTGGSTGLEMLRSTVDEIHVCKFN